MMKDRVKLAKCTPDGRFTVTSDIFEGDSWELDLFSSENEYEYLQFKNKNADYLSRTCDERGALDLYRDVLTETIKAGRLFVNIRSWLKRHIMV